MLIYFLKDEKQKRGKGDFRKECVFSIDPATARVSFAIFIIAQSVFTVVHICVFSVMQSVLFAPVVYSAYFMSLYRILMMLYM